MQAPIVSHAPTFSRECRFCSYFTGERWAHEADRPWLRNRDYAALVSVGALVPGWSLICPTSHGLNLSEHYRSQKFWEFAEKAVAICQAQYGEVAVFEHGACSMRSATSCGTAHAHLHVVPLKFSLSEATIQFHKERTWERCLVTDLCTLVRGNEYLFMADAFYGDRTQGYVSLLKKGTSQFFRRVIANRFGDETRYDYRIYPNHAISESSATILRDAAKTRRRQAA